VGAVFSRMKKTSADQKRPKRKPAAPQPLGIITDAGRLALDAAGQPLDDQFLARILDAADDAIISVNSAQRIILFNRGAEKIFGWSAPEVIGQPLNVLLPKDTARVHRQHVREFSDSGIEARRMAERGEIAGRRKNGENFPAEASISQIDAGGSKIFTVILRDITKQKAAAEKIRASLREKEVLLKEIHHRVKNNLQVISSLLSLQSRGIEDEKARKFFQESQHRVHSMALIHEQLFESRDLSWIDFASYIEQLIAYLFRSYGVSLSRVKLKTRIPELHFTVDIAVPCGLIINELASNSLKYGFPDGRAGEIEITFKKGPGGRVTLLFQDNGVGFPKHVSLLNTRTLGLRLVRTLVQQLGGQVELKNRNGAQVRINFSPDPATTER
jgi:two-component system, sensor histidine kinase PdtaS